MLRQTSIILVIVIFNFFSIIKTQYLPLCDSLNGIHGNEIDKDDHSEIKSRGIRALCDAIYVSPMVSQHDELYAIPDFDLTQINSDNDANQILKRFRRSRFSSGSRSGSSSSGSSGSRSSSIFGGSRSSSSSSSGSGSRGLFGGSSSSGSGGNRIFRRSSGSSSSSSSGSRSGFFARTPSSGSSNTGSHHRVRDAMRTMFRRSSAVKPPGIPSTSGGLSGGSGHKPSLTDKIRQIGHGGGGGGSGQFGSGTGGSSNRFGSGTGTGGFGTGGSSSRFGSGMGTGGFGTGGSSGSGGNVWVRAGKKFLPVAVRYGKRYYQRRKYSKGMYAGIGAGAGYYAGSRMSRPHGQNYPQDHYNYPPVVDNPPDQIDGQTPTVFYCIQEDLNATLVNKTLNSEGFGVCNISGELVTCPIEIECQTNEADNCCEDEVGAPFCCGGPIPDEYTSQYGGYGDDMYDTADSFNSILNIMTVISVLLATVCFTMWQRRGQ